MGFYNSGNYYCFGGNFSVKAEEAKPLTPLRVLLYDKDSLK